MVVRTRWLASFINRSTVQRDRQARDGDPIVEQARAAIREPGLTVKSPNWPLESGSPAVETAGKPRFESPERRIRMATWTDVISYLNRHYTIADHDGDLLHLNFRFEDGRTQKVFVHRLQAASAEEWVSVESPFAKVDPNIAMAALDLSSGTICGGLSRVGDFLTWRHTAPLQNLDANELEMPLHLITAFADDLEQRLLGVDQH